MHSVVDGAITKKVRSLEQISFKLVDFNEGLELKQLVAYNKKLREVEVFLPLEGSEVPNVDSYELDMILETIRIFSKCEELSELTVKGHNTADLLEDEELKCPRHADVDNVLSDTLLRRRRVTVSVMGCAYLPVGRSSE